MDSCHYLLFNQNTMPNYKALIQDEDTNIQYIAEQLAPSEQEAKAQLIAFYVEALDTEESKITIQSIFQI
jgi:hypothetical protein